MGSRGETRSSCRTLGLAARLLGMVGAVLSLAHCGGDEDGCGVDEYYARKTRCLDGTVQRCANTSFEDETLHAAWRTDRVCGSAELCVVDSDGAFCALSPAPSSACAGAASLTTCEGSNARVQCHSGYVTQRRACLSCVPGESYPVCYGGLAEPCSADGQCVEGLLCRGPSGYPTNLQCTQYCTTADDCQITGIQVAPQEYGYTFSAECYQGVCLWNGL
jgi:hypothetical protein